MSSAPQPDTLCTRCRRQYRALHIAKLHDQTRHVCAYCARMLKSQGWQITPIAQSMRTGATYKTLYHNLRALLDDYLLATADNHSAERTALEAALREHDGFVCVRVKEPS